MFKNYRYGGICAILTAVISIPATLMTVLTVFAIDPQYKLLSQLLTVGYTVLLTFLYLFILEFMEEKLGITKAKWLIYSLIGTNMLTGIPAVLISPENTELFVYNTILSTALMIVAGIIAILLGNKLMKSPNQRIKHAGSAGMWFTITGILMVTYILSPFALLTGLVIDVYLALMFFAKENETLDDQSTNSPEIA